MSPENSVIDNAVSKLKDASQRFAQLSLLKKVELVETMLSNLDLVAEEWVNLACQAKQITTASGRSEEILTGPTCTARSLRLLRTSLLSIHKSGKPTIPGAIHRDSADRMRVPVFPAQGVFDSVVFRGMRAEVWIESGEQDIHGGLLTKLISQENGGVALVLGAGNVSTIPVTDTLTKMFQENKVVLLKLNPVNDYLAPVYERLFSPLIEQGYLQVIKGDGQVGAYACHHEGVETIHITGSHHTHDAIVWGPEPDRERRKANNDPVLSKPITSELGNVSPWIVIPGNYSPKELHSQATNIAASLVNNAGFNCLTTRVIVTSQDWPQRDQFLQILRDLLQEIPPRVGYYPGTAERFEQFTGKTINNDDGTFPWLLLEGVSANEPHAMFEEESFVCACAEVPLPGLDEAFMSHAERFCNEKLFGTLCVAITVPNTVAQPGRKLNNLIDSLNYGVVSINQWPGLVYGLMTPPWGAAPGEQLINVQSGIGSVHNLYFLDHIEKTVFYGPLTMFPKPVWLPAHKTAEQVSWALFKIYVSPSFTKLPMLFAHALLG